MGVKAKKLYKAIFLVTFFSSYLSTQLTQDPLQCLEFRHIIVPPLLLPQFKIPKANHSQKEKKERKTAFLSELAFLQVLCCKLTDINHAFLRYPHVVLYQTSICTI